MVIIERKPKYPPIEDSDIVCYLILHIGIPSKISPAHSRVQLETMTSARKAGDLLGINISSLKVIWERSNGGYQYVFNFPHYERNDKQAQLIAEMFLLAITFYSGPFLDEDFTPSTFRIPKALMSKKGSVEGRKLIQLEESRGFYERTLNYLSVLRGGSLVSPWNYNYAWKLTPLLFQNEALRRAVRYLVLSQYNFYITPGEIQEVLDYPNDTAQTSVEQNRFEVALHNAFKAIEAIIGDPPKSNNKFYASLNAVGLNPNDLVGYGQKQPIAQVIRNMGKARDKKSAHGSTPLGDITIGEMMEFQACAHLVVSLAIEKALSDLKRGTSSPQND